MASARAAGDHGAFPGMQFRADGIGGAHALKRFRAKWIPVRVKKTRQNKNLEPGADSITTGKALGCAPVKPADDATRVRQLCPSGDPVRAAAQDFSLPLAEARDLS